MLVKRLPNFLALINNSKISKCVFSLVRESHFLMSESTYFASQLRNYSQNWCYLERAGLFTERVTRKISLILLEYHLGTLLEHFGVNAALESSVIVLHDNSLIAVSRFYQNIFIQSILQCHNSYWMKKGLILASEAWRRIPQAHNRNWMTFASHVALMKNFNPFWTI